MRIAGTLLLAGEGWGRALRHALENRAEKSVAAMLLRRQPQARTGAELDFRACEFCGDVAFAKPRVRAEERIDDRVVFPRLHAAAVTERQVKVVDAAKEVQGALAKIARGLVERSKTDAKAQQIVTKFGIKVNNPTVPTETPAP